MNVADFLPTHRNELLLALLLSPVLAYVSFYAMLRFFGTLRVNAGGWLAETIRIRAKTLFPAVWVFSVFGPALRLESAMVRRFDKHAPEAAISEVVVELVQFV